MKQIYLDNAATTPVDERVVKAMLPYFSEKFGNASSQHLIGQEAKRALEESREIIAKAIINALSNEGNSHKIAVGIGGPHYCSNFNKILLRTDIAVSHICPKYHLQDLNENLIKQSMEKTAEKVNFILLDWKGLGKEKQRILDILKNLSVEIKKTEQIL